MVLYGIGLDAKSVPTGDRRVALFLGAYTPTYVFYTDEAGDPKPHSCPLANGQTPIFTLAGVVFPLEKWRSYEREYQQLKARFFPDDVARKGGRKDLVEIKGNELTSPRQKNSDRRKAFLKAVLSLISRNGGNCFGVTFIKNCNVPAAAKSIYTKGFQILLERYNAYLEDCGTSNNGIIICDSRASTIRGTCGDAEVSSSYMSYIYGNRVGKTLTHIQEAPLFTDSKLTAGIQIADNFASLLFTNHYYQHCRDFPGAPDYQHVSQYWPKIHELEYKRPSERMFGFRVVDHDKKSCGKGERI